MGQATRNNTPKGKIFVPPKEIPKTDKQRLKLGKQVHINTQRSWLKQSTINTNDDDDDDEDRTQLEETGSASDTSSSEASEDLIIKEKEGTFLQ